LPFISLFWPFTFSWRSKALEAELSIFIFFYLMYLN